MKTLIRLVLLAAVSLCSQAADSPVAVNAVPLEQVLIYPEASAPATVVSLNDSRIGAELNAPVRTIPVRVGDIVPANGLLVELDCADYQLSADELESRLAGIDADIVFARQRLERVRRLEKRRTVAEELLDEREAELAGLLADRQAAQASLEKARRDLAKCTVEAPFEAVVLDRLVSVGEYATPGTALVRVLDLTRLEVSADVLANDAAALSQATSIVFRHNKRDYPVTLRTVTPVIDELARTREARLRFTDEAALAGATGRLVWTLAAALPPDLIVRRSGQLGVLLAENGNARFQPLPDAQEGRPAVVDLPPETLLIVEGRFALSDGDPVTLRE